MKARSGIVDLLRFLAILLMVIFHFSFDLNAFHLVQIDFFKEPFWYGLPRLIVSLFMTSMGASLYFSHSKGIRWRSFNKRLLQLVISAIAITVTTYFIFPQNWIFFGTLHSIAVCSLLALPFLKVSRWIGIIGVLIIAPHLSGIYQYPFWSMAHKSMDYIPPLPWLGFVFIGMSLGYSKYSKWSLPQNRATAFITQVSNHSLIIYLLHQPVLWGLVWLISRI